MTPELLVTITLAVVALTGTILKIVQQRTANTATQQKLATAEEIVSAIGTAVNTVTPALGIDKAKLLKSRIKGTANAAGVLDDLDALLKRHGLNDRGTAELANPHV